MVGCLCFWLSFTLFDQSLEMRIVFCESLDLHGFYLHLLRSRRTIRHGVSYECENKFTAHVLVERSLRKFSPKWVTQGKSQGRLHRYVLASLIPWKVSLPVFEFKLCEGKVLPSNHQSGGPRTHIHGPHQTMAKGRACNLGDCQETHTTETLKPFAKVWKELRLSLASKLQEFGGPTRYNFTSKKKNPKCWTREATWAIDLRTLGNFLERSIYVVVSWRWPLRENRGVVTPKPPNVRIVN